MINFINNILKKASNNILLSFFMFSLFSCNNEMQIPHEVALKDSLPEVQVDDIKLEISDSGIVVMKLYATELIDYTQKEKPYTEFPKGVLVNFFDKEHKQNSSLKAGYARYDEEKDIWIYKKNVELINQQGDKLYTDYLVADQKNDSLFSNENVKVIFANGSEKESSGFRSNLDFTEYEFLDIIVTVK